MGIRNCSYTATEGCAILWTVESYCDTHICQYVMDETNHLIINKSPENISGKDGIARGSILAPCEYTWIYYYVWRVALANLLVSEGIISQCNCLESKVAKSVLLWSVFLYSEEVSNMSKI